jgi:hypothetical protein
VAPKTARQLGILAVLLVVLVVALTYNRENLSDPSAPPTRRAAAARVTAGRDDVGVVDMPSLTTARPEPEGGARNPFRFRPAAPPPSFEQARRPQGPGAMAGSTMPAEPAGPPPLPPITLKFIGVVEQSARLKLAVLSDGRNVFYGKEGDAIEGRYRIERIGPESIDMAYLDGRGRQTLRLSGS